MVLLFGSLLSLSHGVALSLSLFPSYVSAATTGWLIECGIVQIIGFRVKLVWGSDVSLWIEIVIVGSVEEVRIVWYVLWDVAKVDQPPALLFLWTSFETKIKNHIWFLNLDVFRNQGATSYIKFQCLSHASGKHFLSIMLSFVVALSLFK